MNNKRTKIIIFVLILSGSSCNNKHQNIDVSDVDIDIAFQRFDKDVFSFAPDSINEYTGYLYPKYGEFYRVYIEDVLHFGSINDPMMGYNLQHFVSDADIKKLYSDCNKQFSDKVVDKLQDDLRDAFKRYAYYFPLKNIPTIVFYFSGLNYSILTLKEHLGIAFDMYLDKDCYYYEMRGYPQYKKKSMSKDYIVADAMKGWLSTEFVLNTNFEQLDKKSNNMLSYIVHYGKIMYMLDEMLPSVHDSLKIDYTEKQLQWCKGNEFELWTHFIDQKLLFSCDAKEIIKYTDDAPFISGFPEGSPGRLGNWLGWQIVRAYMENMPDASLVDLINEKDAQKILNSSNYKPR